MNARELWQAAVRAGEDYPCKYWAIAACEYRGSFGCDCRGIREYRQKASADTRPEGGDGTKIAAPFTSGAVGAAETPNPSRSLSGDM